jgi:hypothetical protein
MSMPVGAILLLRMLHDLDGVYARDWISNTSGYPLRSIPYFAYRIVRWGRGR